MMSIIKHWGKFVITLILTIIIVLFYSFLMLTYFNTQINTDDYDIVAC